MPENDSFTDTWAQIMSLVQQGYEVTFSDRRTPGMFVGDTPCVTVSVLGHGAVAFQEGLPATTETVGALPHILGHLVLAANVKAKQASKS